MVFHMFSHKPCIGGIILIKEGNLNIARVDIYGDLVFSESIDHETQKEVLMYLAENNIDYNKD